MILIAESCQSGIRQSGHLGNSGLYSTLHHIWHCLSLIVTARHRLADPRHSFASGGLLVGEGLPMIGKLLGHNKVQTTARYAHLANDPIKSAANRISSRIAEVAG